MTAAVWLQTLAATAAASVLVGAAGWIQSLREQRFEVLPVADTALYVRSGPLVKRMAVGYDMLAADLYWIRAIQYFGGIRRRLADPAGTLQRGEPMPTDYAELYPLLDLTTTLDPDFEVAYRFGSIFLAEPFPSGAGRPDLAIALLEKGLLAQPDRWAYMQDIGFVHYWWKQDYQTAAEWFRRGSALPGAPWWLESLAAVTLAEGGDRATSRLMWEAIRQSADNDWLRRDAERRLLQLQAMDDIDALQAEIDRIRAAEGPVLLTWEGLVARRRLARIPVDPSGIPYELVSGGRVALSASSPLAPLPSEPKRAGAVS
ncbi:MAG: hypothetical protein AB7F99_11860 [Vicinamibacterales bacterium]